MNIKRTFCTAILVVTTVISLTACAPKKTVTIGFSAGLTGSTSDMGVNGRNGLMMAVNEVNAAGGVNNRQVEVIVKDDQNNPETALAVDQELYEEGVSFIIGHMTSNMAELSLPFVKDNNLLMISPTMSSHELVNQDDHFITVVSSNDVEAAFIAKIVLENGGKNIAVIYELQNGLYTNTIKAFVGSDLAEKGGQIIYQEAFQAGNNPSYLEISNRVLSTQPDSIVILASSFDAAMFCQQFYKLGSQVPLYLSLWAMNNDLILQGGDAVEGVQIPSLIDTESQKAEYLNFREAYFNQYGSVPNFAAIYSYEAAKILFETMETKNSFDPEIIKEAIIKKSHYQGLQGEITIDKNGDAKRSLYHYLIKDGQFEKVD